MDNKLFNDLTKSIEEAKQISEGTLKEAHAFSKKDATPKLTPLNLPVAADLELTPPTESEFVNIWEGGKRTAMFGPQADISEETQKLFSKPLTGAAASYGIPRDEIVIINASTPPEASKLDEGLSPTQRDAIPNPRLPTSKDTKQPYSMYVDQEDVASAEDLMGRLKHHVKLLERSFSLGQVLPLEMHLTGIEALVKGIKKYSEQLPPATFPDLFKEEKAD